MHRMSRLLALVVFSALILLIQCAPSAAAREPRTEDDASVDSLGASRLLDNERADSATHDGTRRRIGDETTRSDGPRVRWRPRLNKRANRRTPPTEDSDPSLAENRPERKDKGRVLGTRRKRREAERSADSEEDEVNDRSTASATRAGDSANQTTADCSLRASSGRGALRLFSRKFRSLFSGDVTTRNAFRMGVLSSMAYWDFPKKGLPTGGFHLKDDFVPGTIRRDCGLCLKQLLYEAMFRVRIIFCLIRRRLPRILRRQHHRRKPQLLKSANHEKKFYEGAVQQGTIAPSFPSLRGPSCRQLTKSIFEEGQSYQLEWYLYNWHEKGPGGIRWHDTDLLISTSGPKTLVLSFAGTASAADHFTNVQTFEPVSHSGFFSDAEGISLEGSIHRGFLNAFSRVERGFALHLLDNDAEKEAKSSKISGFLSLTLADHCQTPKRPRKKRRGRNNTDSDLRGVESLGTVVETVNSENSTHWTSRSPYYQTNTKRGEEGKGCRMQGTKLSSILRDVVTRALDEGNRVHLTGHSLGGGLATILALDIILNFPETPVSKLSVWTFGAPEVADDLFYESALVAYPRLGRFVRRNGRGGEFHRFVTLSDKCVEDFVSTVASRALPAHKRNLRGRAARRLGGARGGIGHFVHPTYLSPPPSELNSNATATVGSSLSAHQMKHYLRGLQREAIGQLNTNMPLDVVAWLDR